MGGGGREGGGGGNIILRLMTGSGQVLNSS